MCAYVYVMVSVIKWEGLKRVCMYVSVNRFFERTYYEIRDRS